MSEALRESNEHWTARYSEACDVMREIRHAIHNQRMAHCPQSQEFAVLDSAYKQADAIISQFHQKGDA